MIVFVDLSINEETSVFLQKYPFHFCFEEFHVVGDTFPQSDIPESGHFDLTCQAIHGKSKRRDVWCMCIVPTYLFPTRVDNTPRNGGVVVNECLPTKEDK